MRSATSFFDKTMIRMDLRRYWPLLFLYTAVWTVMLPVYQWVDQGFRFGDEGFYPGDYLYDMMFASMIMAVIFCGLFAMAVFSYTMNSRSVGLMHALPVSRTTHFFSHVGAVMGMLGAGKLLVAVLTVLEQAMFGDVAWKAIVLWLLVATLVEFFFLSLGVLCSMVTGWLLAMPVLYAVANALAIMLTQLLRMLGELFYFGYSGNNSYPAITRWLTPLYTMGEALADNVRYTEPSVEIYDGAAIIVENAVRQPRILNPEVPGVLAVYTAVAVLMLAFSWLLYTRRASESAGDPVAFSWARPIFRYGVALCGGLAFGLGLYAVLTVNRDLPDVALLIFCMALMGVLSYFAVEMVIRKSFRVFRKGWPGAIVVSVVLALVCIGAKLDITGYETRIPDVEKIESVEVSIYMENIYVNQCTEPETIDAILALHEAIVAEGRVPVELEGNYGVNLEYELEDGTWMRRRYTLSLPAAVESAAITDALETLINTEEIRYKTALNGRSGSEQLELRGGYISGRHIEYDLQLTAEDARRIYAAVLRDLAAGAGGQEPFKYEAQEVCTVYIELDAGTSSVWLDRLRPDFENTVAVLNDLGLDSTILFAVDEKYVEKYGW